MKLTTKVLIHYIVNLAVILFTVGTLVVTFSLKSGRSSDASITIPFVSLLLATLLTLTISTLVLANDQSKPWRSVLPIILSSFLLTIMGTLIVVSYNNFFDNGSEYWTIFGAYPWQSLLMILLVIPYVLLFIVINIYTTKFSLISVSGDISSEWTIKNTYSLLRTKSEIKHCKDFSYLVSSDKLLVIRFNSEDIVERVIVFEEDERNAKTPLISKMEDKINELSSLNITINGSIVYLSNRLPNKIGNSSNIHLWKNKELFINFKNIEGKGNIIVKDIIKEIN